MGFYSIYKIIKDIIKTLFGNKFLKLFIISSIIFTIFFIFCENNVLALSSNSLTTVSLNGSNYDLDLDYLTGQYNYYFLCWSTDKSGSSNYYTNLDLFCSNDEMTFSNSGDEVSVRAKTGSSFIRFHVLRINSNNFLFNNAVSTWNNTVFNPSLNNHTYTSSTLTTVTQNISSSSSYYSFIDYKITLANYNVKDKNNNIVFNNNVYKNPTLSNSQTDLENLNFSNFIINANSYTEEIENNDGTLYMLFYNKSLDKTTVDYLYPIKEKGFTKGSIYTDYENSTSDNMVFSFPLFMSGVFFNKGSTYQIRFAKQNYNAEYGIMTYEYLGDPYTFTISSNVTQDYINQLNQQTATSTDSESTQELQSSINQQTQSINDINNSINDSNVDNSSINLPTDNTNDPTQTGVDNIFQTIYNSFTSGTAQDIVFPIPFTNKNITLHANYIYNMLQNNGASWVINIIQAFWWYIISRFIITDIMKKIRKIKQGNFENIQNSNIKEDML